MLQVLHDCQRYRSNIREIGELWVGVEASLVASVPHPPQSPAVACLVLESSALRTEQRQGPVTVPFFTFSEQKLE